MELGMIGLGRMGGNMVRRLLGGDHQLVVYDPANEAVQAVAEQGATGATSIADLASKLTRPRAVWLMVPAGEPTETAINSLAMELSPGDIVIDGGNSYYKDSMRRAAVLSEKEIIFLDVGTSGGIWGGLRTDEGKAGSLTSTCPKSPGYGDTAAWCAHGYLTWSLRPYRRTPNLRV